MLQNHKIFNLFLLMLLLFSFFVFNKHILAQKKPYNEEITIIAPYQPSISDAIKININPKINDTIIKKPEVNYILNPKKIETSLRITLLKPARILNELTSKLYRTYIKLGIGNYTTSYGELFFNSLRSKKYSYSAHLKHLSSSGKINNFAPSGFSNNEINFFGSNFSEKNILSENISYKRNVVHFYGFHPEDFNPQPSKDDIKQIFNLFKAKTKFKSINTDDSYLNYSTQIEYYYLSDNYNTIENNVNFNANLNKYFQILNFTDRQDFAIAANVDFYNNKSIFYKTSNTALIKVAPSLSTLYKKFNLKLGINTIVKIDSISDIHFYPIVQARSSIIDKYLYFNAMITGDMQRNSFNLFKDKNPFIISGIPVSYKNNKFKVYAGFDGRLSNCINYSLSVSNSIINNMPFFVKDTNNLYENKFTVIYDDVNIFNSNVEISFQKNDKLKIMLRANYYKYLMDDEAKAWYKPDFDVSLSANYNIQKKIIIKTEIFAYDKMYYKSYKNNHIESKEINSLIDYNIGFEYIFTKRLSAFLNLNNVENKSYYRWEGYPTQKFNLIAGINYSI